MGDVKSPFCFGKTKGRERMKPEIRNAILAIPTKCMTKPSVNTVMVDGAESIIIDGDWSMYEKVREALNGFDVEGVRDIPVYFDEEIWFCSGCKEWHRHEDTPMVTVQYYWQFCADAIEKLEDVRNIYIEYLINNPKSCNLFGEEFLRKHGFVKMETRWVKK